MYETHEREELLTLARYVGHQVARVRHWVREGSPQAWSEQQVQHAVLEARRAGVALPDQGWAARLGLSALEVELLWWSSAPHLEGELSGQLQERYQQDYVDGALLQRVLGGGALGGRAVRQGLRALVRFGLVRLEARPGRQVNELRCEVVPSEHVLCALDGQRATPLERAGLARPLRPAVRLAAVGFAGEVVQGVEALRGFRARGRAQEAWFGEAGVQVPRGLCVAIDAPRGQGASLCARALCGELGVPALEVSGEALSRSPQGEALTRQLFQEARAYGEVLVVRDAEWVCGEERGLASSWGWHLCGWPVAVLLCATHRPMWHPSVRDALHLQLSPSLPQDAARQALQWQLHLPGDCQVEAGAVEAVSGELALQPGQVRGAARLLSLTAPLREGALQVEAEALRLVARQQLERPTSALARVVSDRARLRDLILPLETQREVEALVSAIQRRRMIMEEWGLRAVLGRGVGLSALFDGDPGTGKTLAAEAIAGQCEMSLMQVDTSTIVDKYIGETEKNLTELFAQARPDLHILLFDEADSLFGKRTEVRHATDRYANMNINTLLQLIERYEGVTILTTNLKKSIDPAFERRLTFKINFPKPGLEERLSIWRRLLRPPLRLGGEVELRELAEVELTGGEIKNALLKAAYQAARAGGLLDTEALMQAALDEARGAGHLIRAR